MMHSSPIMFETICVLNVSNILDRRGWESTRNRWPRLTRSVRVELCAPAVVAIATVLFVTLRRGCTLGLPAYFFLTCLTLSAAANELNDFQTVAVFKKGLRPAAAGGDFAVEFYGDAVRFHVERFDQCRQRELRPLRVREGPFFAINQELHHLHFLTEALISLLGFAQGEFPRDSAAFMIGLDHYGGIWQGGFVDFD
jgi:hypothetical protein